MGNPESWQLAQRISSAFPRLRFTALVVQRFVVPALSSESQSTTVSSKPGEALAFLSFTPYRHTLARVPSHPLTFTLCRWSGTSCRGAPALRPARRVPEHHLALQSWQLVQRTSSAFPRLHSTALVVQRFVVPALSAPKRVHRRFQCLEPRRTRVYRFKWRIFSSASSSSSRILATRPANLFR